MDKQDRRALKEEARQCLAQASYDPQKLIFIHAGATVLLSAILMIADYFLEQQIGSTGGLGGIGARSMLATMQTILRLAQTVLLPFWQMGYVYATLKISRKEAAAPQDLAEGFRRFGPVLRLSLLKTVIFSGIGLISIYLSTSLFFMTPFAAPMLNQLAPLMNDTSLLEDPTALQEAATSAIEDAMLPLLIIFAIIYLAFTIPLFYRYRMASYFLLDDPQQSAYSSLRSSRKLMRFLCTDLFKLDLNFWWFYLLEVLISIICYGDLLLGWLGIPLPFSADLGYFLFFGLYLLSQLALYCWRKNEVEVTYACAYNFLRDAHDPRQQPKPKKQPWVY